MSLLYLDHYRDDEDPAVVAQAGLLLLAVGVIGWSVALGVAVYVRRLLR